MNCLRINKREHKINNTNEQKTGERALEKRNEERNLKEKKKMKTIETLAQFAYYLLAILRHLVFPHYPPSYYKNYLMNFDEFESYKLTFVLSCFVLFLSKFE